MPTTTSMPCMSTPIANNPHGSNNVVRCLTPVVQNKDQLLALIGPYPYEAPDGFKLVPNGWKLEKQVKPSTPVSFEEMFLDKIKGPVNKQKGKRMKLDLRGKVYPYFYYCVCCFNCSTLSLLY